MSTPKVILAFDIWHDIRRHFLVYVLLMLVVVSAFSVIYFTHVNRQTTSELEQLLTERDELDIEWRTYYLNRTAWQNIARLRAKQNRS